MVLLDWQLDEESRTGGTGGYYMPDGKGTNGF